MNDMKHDRAFHTLYLICFLLVSTEIHSLAGYINSVFYTGSNLVANQLLSGDDTLTNLFTYQIPNGATFTKWNPASNQYSPVSTYHSGIGWNINYSLTLGEGGLFYTPQPFTNTFVGIVWPGFNADTFDLPYFGQPVLTNSGVFLLSCLIPISHADFQMVVGRDPQNGESVTILNALSQISTTTMFANGVWNNGTPTLGIGQSAFFNLESTPEPGVLSLTGAGAFLIAALCPKRK